MRSEENDRRMNFLTKTMPKLYDMQIFCLDNYLPRTGTWEKAKRHRRNLNSDWRTKRTGKKQVYNHVFGRWSGQNGTNRLFWVVRRDVGFRSPYRDCPDEIGTVGKYVFRVYIQQKCGSYRHTHEEMVKGKNTQKYTISMDFYYCVCFWPGKCLVTREMSDSEAERTCLVTTHVYAVFMQHVKVRILHSVAAKFFFFCLCK